MVNFVESRQSTVDRVTLVPYSNCHCRSHVVADLLPVSATNRQQRDFDSYYTGPKSHGQLSTFNKVDRVEFNLVASVYRALN